MRSASEDDTLGVLDRMTRILEAFEQTDAGLGVSEIASRSGLPKSTVSRLVTTLVRQGYLERDGRLHHLGLRLFELGQLAEQPRQLRLSALPVMVDLRNKTGEHVHLAILDQADIVCIAAVRGRSGVPAGMRTGSRAPAHTTALGRAMLEHSPPAGADPVGAIRQGDPTVAVWDRESPTFSAGVPLFAPTGALVGALSVSGPADCFDAGRQESAICAAARAIERRLAAAPVD